MSSEKLAHVCKHPHTMPVGHVPTIVGRWCVDCGTLWIHRSQSVLVPTRGWDNLNGLTARELADMHDDRLRECDAAVTRAARLREQLNNALVEGQRLMAQVVKLQDVLRELEATEAIVSCTRKYCAGCSWDAIAQRHGLYTDPDFDLKDTRKEVEAQ